MTKLPRHLLPESLLQIAEYCGDDVMWTIWQHYAGMPLHVPLSVTPEHRLAELLGYKNACLLCESFGNEQLLIAKAEAAKRAVRNVLIRKARQEGAPLGVLARRHDLTTRQIQQICRDSDNPPANYDLFDEV